MLSKQIFAESFQPLCEWYNRAPSVLVIDAYYEHLKTLTPAEWQSAVRAAIATESFMPPAATLYALVKGTDDEQAMDQWQRALIAARDAIPAIEAGMDETAIATIQSLGGLATLGRCNEYERGRWSERFADLYKSAHRRAATLKALPSRGSR